MPDLDREFLLTNARIPSFLIERGGFQTTGEDLACCDLLVRDGRIVALEPAGAIRADAPRRDLDLGIVFPQLVDIHTHLDKGHIWPRRQNENGTHSSAKANVAADRAANWSLIDVRARMEFALKCAYAHGTRALRTHIDSLAPQGAISWPVFSEVREAWKGRIELQAAALFPIDLALSDEPAFFEIVDLAAKHGGVLGGLTYFNSPADEQIETALLRVFEAADARGLDLDFHTDESDSPKARSLGVIADVKRRTGFRGKVVAGHCCSLALAEPSEAAGIIARVADAGVAVVSLPMCNMYLQGRSAGKTPRWRGVAPLHELAAAGVDVAVASDNTRDPFYAYGDLDPVEVFREATRIVQFDHNGLNWLQTLTTSPGGLMRLHHKGGLEIGAPADLILFRARTLNELNSRPQADRKVFANGRLIVDRLPDYRDLDRVLGLAV